MTARYTHLQPEDRLTLASLHQQGFSQRAMARLLGRSPSTISREFRRNGGNSDGYAFKPAQAACEARRQAAQPLAKLHHDGALWGVVCNLLLWRWSPQQIARTLRCMHPDDISWNASNETIYNAIYAYPQCAFKTSSVHYPQSTRLSCKTFRAKVSKKSPKAQKTEKPLQLL